MTWRHAAVVSVAFSLAAAGCGQPHLGHGTRVQPPAGRSRGSSVRQELERIRPEDAGYSSSALAAAAQYAKDIGYSALVLAYDGKVLFTSGEIEKNYLCHSIRKPLLSALYGTYVENGKIDLDRSLENLAIDDIEPSLTSDEKKATIRHLLQGRSGVYHAAAAEEQSMIKLRPQRGSHPPGSSIPCSQALGVALSDDDRP